MYHNYLKAKNLVILFVQRCGSTLMCDDISQTNSLGKPTEIFNSLINDMIDGVANQSLLSQFNTALNNSKTTNGVHAFKISADSIEAMGLLLKKLNLETDDSLSVCFANFIRNHKILRLCRRSKIEQAISQFVAIESSVFHVFNDCCSVNDLVGDLVYSYNSKQIKCDSNKIYQYYKKICSDEKFIDDFLELHGLSADTLYYEDIVCDNSYLYRIADMMGVNISLPSITDRRINKLKSNHLIYDAFIQQLSRGSIGGL